MQATSLHAVRLVAFIMKCRRFLAAEDGVALVYFAIALPAFLAMAAMAVDVGRGSSLQSDLQRAADGLAVAAAAELDGRSDSVERANRAIANLVRNQARFTDDGAVIVDDTRIRVFYLDEVPANDDTPIDNAWVSVHERSDEPRLVRFAAVFMEPVRYSLLFPIDLIGFSNVETGAHAVAGFSSSVCNIAPMFICNPYEGTGTTIQEAMADPANRRKMIVMRQKGGSSAWGPGNFGFLRATEGSSSANELRDLFANVSPAGCYSTSGVYLNSGQTSTIRRGLNVRFDVYEGNFSGQKNNANYRPARSVRKQYGGTTCNSSYAYTTASGYRRLRRDSCFATSSCTEMDGRMGDGIWDFESYWTTNFPGIAYPTVDGVTWGNGSANLPSRYQVYRYEIDNNLTGQRSLGSGGVSNPNGEKGAPLCYGGGTLNDTPDRRLFLGAIINCIEHADQMNGSSGGAIPVETFGTFFITEPLENGGSGGSTEDNGDDSIRAEIVDVNDEQNLSGLPGLGRDGAQLYR